MELFTEVISYRETRVIIYDPIDMVIITWGWLIERVPLLLRHCTSKASLRTAMLTSTHYII